MANVPIPLSKLLPQQDQDKSANVSVAATTDTAIVPIGTRGTVLAIVNGATTTNITILHGPGGAHDHTFEVNNGKTRLVWLTDTSYYAQSDGCIHVVSDQAVSMFALSVGHTR